MGGQISPGAGFVRLLVHISERVCVVVLVRGWEAAQPPTWKLMLSTVGGHLFLVAACRAETNSGCSAFLLWSSAFYVNIQTEILDVTQNHHLVYYYLTFMFTASGS